MIIPLLKDEVKDQKKVRFLYYKEGVLWYETESHFTFPVPSEDIGNATFFAEDKAILFMRYIRKEIERLYQLSLILESTKKSLEDAS